MNKILFLLFAINFTLFAQNKPNIVLIMADDMGYGDVEILNKIAKTKTPYINLLAKQGMTFTDAHSPSSVCTPTRYGLLTGRYAWRSKLKTGVLWGYSKPLIEPQRETMATFLQKNGYNTACFGKWHLGLNWQAKDASKPMVYGKETDPDSINIDFSRLVSGVKQAGFNEHLVIPASLDMQPYCFIKNEKVLGLPMLPYAGEAPPQPSRLDGRFHRKGMIANNFTIENALPTFVNEAENFIKRNTKNPFFLYLPLNSPHTPWAPGHSFKGKSPIGIYGDFVAQTDDAVGSIMKLLDSLKLSENTIVIFTSDNGAYWDDAAIKKLGHAANGEFRGQKGDTYEAGHHVPFFVKWSGKIKPNTSTKQLVCLTDIFATVADILKNPMTENSCEDSFSFLPTLVQKKPQSTVREVIVHHSSDSMFVIRQGNWKLIMGLGSGGFTKPAREKVQSGGPAGQLYHLKTDPKESKNLWIENQNIVWQLTSLLNNYKEKGNSKVMK